MYLPPQFREDRPDGLFNLIKHHPLGLVVSTGAGGLQANLVPWVVYPEEGEHGVLRGHVARANPQWRELIALSECLVVFQGPQAYVSPSWYPSKGESHRVVPTWNYVTVHVWAEVRLCEDAAWLRRQLDDLTDVHEGKQLRPWRVGDAPDDFVAAQMKGIVGLELLITRKVGKWKLSQNRSVTDQRGVIDGLRATDEAGARAIADLMEARERVGG
jgi:transcriptional regulator